MSRIQVPVSEKPRQEIEKIAAKESRSVPVQSAVLLEIGLAAYKKGYAADDGELTKIEKTKAS